MTSSSWHGESPTSLELCLLPISHGQTSFRVSPFPFLYSTSHLIEFSTMESLLRMAIEKNAIETDKSSHRFLEYWEGLG